MSINLNAVGDELQRLQNLLTSFEGHQATVEEVLNEILSLLIKVFPPTPPAAPVTPVAPVAAPATSVLPAA